MKSKYFKNKTKTNGPTVPVARASFIIHIRQEGLAVGLDGRMHVLLDCILVKVDGGLPEVECQAFYRTPGRRILEGQQRPIFGALQHDLERLSDLLL